MTTEERVLRLENAFAALSGLAARAQSSTEKIAEMVRAGDERSAILLQLVRSVEERSSTQQEWINQLGAAQANTDVKIAALVDAQIRMADVQANTDAKMATLADAQANTDVKMAALADALIRMADAQADAYAKVAALVNSQVHADARIAALADSVERHISEGHNGKA